jgi:hypothetical protein
MKKIILTLVTILMATSAFASSEFYLADENESWGECYITEENQAEWDEENAKLAAMIEYPELIEIFELMDEYADSQED